MSISGDVFKTHILNERLFIMYLKVAFVIVLFTLRWPCNETMVLGALIVGCGWLSYTKSHAQLTSGVFTHPSKNIVNVLTVGTIALLGMCWFRYDFGAMVET